MINKKKHIKTLPKRRVLEDELYGAYKIFFGTLVSESRLKSLILLRKGKKKVSEILSEWWADQQRFRNLARLKKCALFE
jgi:predicted transcriptional regulator